MRVLVVSNLYPPEVLGGYELLTRDVALRLRARGHEVDVLCTGSGEVGGGTWRTLRLVLPFEQPFRRSRAREMWTAARNVSALRGYVAARGLPDVTLAMSQRRLGLDVVRSLGRSGRPVVATVNDDWPLAYCRPRPRNLRGLARTLLDRSVSRHNTFRGVDFSGAIYLSEALRVATLEAGAGLPVGVVQAQGVDREAFAPRAFRSLGGPLQLLYVGRLHPSKAPDVAIDTVGALQRRGIAAQLTIAGAPHTPAYGAELRARVHSLGLDADVRWLGPVAREDLPNVYRAADLFLFTCRFELEGQGLTYLEAMSCGVPVVAYPCGGARELLEGSKAAACAARCDGEAFADEIGSLLSSEARVREMTDRGFDLLEQRASLERYVDVVEAELTAAAAARAA